VSITANIFKSTALTLSLIAGLFNAETVLAQVTDEIVVEGRYLYTDQLNALKTPVPILNVPQSLSIITNVDIRQQGFRELADIARYTPGVNTSQGEGHRDSIVFRGVRSTADFYLDGVRDDVQYYRSLYNLDQVEVLRGPNALLFGRGGTGGIVNRVTKNMVRLISELIVLVPMMSRVTTISRRVTKLLFASMPIMTPWKIIEIFMMASASDLIRP
jgi:catecholate siderophore receptor